MFVHQNAFDPSGLSSRSLSSGKKAPSERLKKKVLIFQLLEKEPEMNAYELIDRLQDSGFNLTRSSAYRAIAAFREASSLAESEVRCLRIVSSILENAEEGEHLTARQVIERARELGHSVHRSTIYRVLEKLCASNLILSMRRGRQSYYEWKRGDAHHGHLTCIECSKTIEFHHYDLDEMAKAVCKRTGYEFARIEFLVRSICFECWKIKEEVSDVD